MRSTIVSAGLLALTLLTSQAALARPIALEGNTESDLALRNSDINADGLEVEARSIDELFDQLEARTRYQSKKRAGNAGAKPRNSGQKPRQRQRNQSQSRSSGQRNRPSTLNRVLRSPLTNNIATTLAGGVAQRIAGGGAAPGGVEGRSFEYLEARTRSNRRGGSQPRNSGQRNRPSTLGRILRSPVTGDIATTLASGVAQRIAGGGAPATAQPGLQRREVEEYLEVRTRPRRGSGIARAIGRFLKSGTGQNIATTIAGGVAQRIANGGARAQPGYVARRELEEYLETQ